LCLIYDSALFTADAGALPPGCCLKLSSRGKACKISFPFFSLFKALARMALSFSLSLSLSFSPFFFVVNLNGI